jgi:ribonuclease P protein subunit POP4
MKGKNYEITPQNIKNHEIIGLDVCVVESSDPGRKNIKGKVIDETKNTIKIKVGEDTKVFPKKECVFEFDIREKVVIDGKEIMKKPEDRLKE